MVHSKHIQSREAISNPRCASMRLNRFTPEYRLKPWIKRTGTTVDFSSSRKGIDNSAGLRYSSGHRKGRLKILFVVMLPIRRHQPKEVSGEVVSSRKEAATSRS